MRICIVCNNEINENDLYESDDLFCNDDCKWKYNEDEIERDNMFDKWYYDNVTKRLNDIK